MDLSILTATSLSLSLSVALATTTTTTAERHVRRRRLGHRPVEEDEKSVQKVLLPGVDLEQLLELKTDNWSTTAA